jgi:SAM-dependent methyltransferase
MGEDFPLATYRVDTRDAAPDVFVDLGDTDWTRLSWRTLGRPYRVERWAAEKREWEAEHGSAMPVKESWVRFNRHFHELFTTDMPVALATTRRALVQKAAHLDLHGVRETTRELLQLAVWNHVHRVEDAVWDPRGKRALFDGLDLKRPRILYLGAADGYEAMQLLAMYPGGHALLVDYDEFCRTDRFGKFPERYPFLGVDPATGHKRIWYREDMQIDFEVADIRSLTYAHEFDIVLSVGLIEHFPDAHKPEAFALHRRFLKPGGVAILTTPRDQIRGRAFYTIMADYMNYGYRELMRAEQLGLYAHENGLTVRRAGYIKAHNGLVCSDC